MLRFKVFQDDRPAASVNIRDAYLVGSDRVPLRADIEFVDGEIRCDTQARGAAALSILWPIEGLGRIMLETTRLQERKRPYNLHIELARGQLMRISQKREDWGLYDYPDGRKVCAQIESARDLLIEALTADDEAAATRRANAAITASVKAGEAVACFHADILLERPQSSHRRAKRPLGCILEQPPNSDACVKDVQEGFDFVGLDFNWRTLEPSDGKFQPDALEAGMRAFRQRKLPVRGSLLSFDRARLPEWVFGMTGDLDRLREVVGRYLRFVLKQFHGPVRAWEVIRGVHARNDFRLSFEQIMDFTRMAATLAKQLAPRSTAIIGVVLPWGEYYRQDPRTIPSTLYAEMVVRSGINFDALGVEMRFGGQDPGLYVRDLLQISAMLDYFGNLGKPVHITAAGVPSAGDTTRSGCWRAEWTEETQAEWLRDFYRIALSKPFVETISWQALTDRPEDSRFTGVLRSDLTRKPAYEALLALRPLLRFDQAEDAPLEP